MGEQLFITSAIFSVANGTVLLCVNPHRSINRIYFATSIWVALWLSCVAMAIIEGAYQRTEDNAVVLFWLRMNATVAAFFGWYLWLMLSAILKEPMRLRQVIQQSWPWFAACCAVGSLTWSDYFIPPSSSTKAQLRGPLYAVYIGVLVLMGLWLFTTAFSHSRRLTGVRKIEMQFFVFTSIGACVALLGVNAYSALFSASWLKKSGPLIFIGGHALAVWSICFYRVFDAKQIVYSIGQRLLLLISASLSAAILHQTLSRIINPHWSLLWTAATACAAGIILDRQMRRWAGLDSQVRLEIPRRQIIEWARETSNEQNLREKFSQFLRDQCQTPKVIFFSPSSSKQTDSQQDIDSAWLGFDTLCKHGWTTPESLQRLPARSGANECAELMQSQKLGALLAVPKGSSFPSLVVGLGQKDGLRPYTFPDIQILLELAELMDNILTHSRVATHAAQIERMAAVSMISRGLAHDLNSLATPISAFLVHMEEKVTTGAIDSIVLDQAKVSLGVMQDYIRESFFFSGSFTPQFTHIEARAILSEVAQLSQERVRTTKARVTVAEMSDFTFVGDLALLRRLLQNLTFNAIDASQEGGVIELSAKIIGDERVHLQVSDTGSGIPPDIRNRIFEPYYTTKNLNNGHRGLGLGLAICQKITEVHNGDITICPNSPQGTIVTATIPLTLSISPASPNAHKRDPNFPGLKPRVSLPNFGPIQSINGAPS